ncbi:MAG: M20/M25/M40 family metallo-hydrolase, partial [Clostridia bacterium]|nr:M20/M25/M40 family metallo-hydrolase [Clostridia bacterium]
MSDFWAGVQIWFQNFNARYGVAALICLGVLVLALFMYTIIKTVIAGQSKERKVQLRAKMADEKIRLRAAESLADMISYQTTPDDRNELKRLISYIKKRYPKLFAEAEIENSDCGLLFCLKTKNNLKKPLLFCGHLDVVPAGEGWKHPPFGGKSDGGKIYGRGACDCKGPVTAMLEAIESLLCEGDRPQRDLWFAFGGDEETGGEQGAAVFAELLE